jgi:hypothetical protein
MYDESRGFILAPYHILKPLTQLLYTGIGANMIEDDLYEWFMYEEFFNDAIICPHCDIGRLIRLDQSDLHQCDTCDIQYIVTDNE